MAFAIHDAHTHALTRTYFTSLAKQARPDDPVDATLDLIVEKTEIEIPSDDLANHRQRCLDGMDAAGVRSAVTFASLDEEADEVLAFAKPSGGRLLPFALLNPNRPDTPRRVGDLASRGMRGFLLLPALHHFDPGDPIYDPVWRACASAGAPAIVHVGV